MVGLSVHVCGSAGLPHTLVDICVVNSRCAACPCYPTTVKTSTFKGLCRVSWFFCKLPPRGECSAVGLHIQTRSPPIIQALRPNEHKRLPHVVDFTAPLPEGRGTGPSLQRLLSFLSSLSLMLSLAGGSKPSKPRMRCRSVWGLW